MHVQTKKFILVLLALLGTNVRAQSVVFDFEEYTGGANYLWMFNGDMGSVNTSVHHTHIQVTVECVEKDCSKLRLKYHNRTAPEFFEKVVSASELEGILNGKDRVIRYRNETRRALRESWNTAINLDGPVSGIFMIFGVFLTVVKAPIGIARDIYHACHGDGACRLNLKTALEKIQAANGRVDQPIQFRASWPQVRDLGRFIAAIGDRSNDAATNSFSLATCEAGVAQSRP